MKTTIFNSAAMNPSIRCYEDTKPVRQTIGFFNDSVKYSRLTFNRDFYSLDDVVSRSDSDVRKITNRISWEPKTCFELWHSDAVSALADIRDPHLVQES